MKVTNVTVKLSPQSGDRLKAFCTMTLDDEFVVRDLKIIEGTSGLFVAMPSRKLTDHCPKCSGKNHLRASSATIAAHLPEARLSDEEVQGKLHADIAHPINSECRNRLQKVLLEAYEEELRKAGRAEAETDVGGQAEASVESRPPEAEEPSASEESPSDEAPSESETSDGDESGFGEGIL